MLTGSNFRRFALCALLLALSTASSRAASERPWLDGFTLVLLDSEDIPSLYRAKATIEAHGGRIALLHEPNVLMGWVPQGTIAELSGKDNIRAFYKDEAVGEIAAAKRQSAVRAITSFNDIVSGRYERQLASQLASKQQDGWPAGSSDLEPHPDIDASEVDAILRQLGMNPEELRSAPKNESAAMTGTVSTTLFFVESDGSGTDPDLYTWTSQHVQDYINGVNVGLAWWTLMASYQGTCWNAFFVRWEEPTDPRCNQWREMTLHSSSVVSAMVDEVMTNFGYPGSHINQVDAYNTWQVNNYGTDRAYTAFIAYNDGGPHQLTDGRSAFAYLFGPYTFLLFHSFGWRPDQVFTHESGHIFGACDEYADSGCVSSQLCSNGFNLGNCENSPGFVPCMMASNTFTLCSYTDGHIGWRFNPCAPPPLPAPVASGVAPASGKVGTSFDITITGSDFLYGAYVEMGNGVSLNSSTYVGPGEFVVNVSVDELADPGLRSVTVLNRDLQDDVLVDAFTLIPSSRHYVDPMGSDVWPYTTRATAANSLGNVLTATGKGDSILVASTTLLQPPIIFNRDANVYGGWVGNFAAQDPEVSPTILQLTGNLRIQADVLLKGFQLRDGNGLAESLPVPGIFGGAITVRNASATIENCEIFNNDAKDPQGNGGGGAIYAQNSSLTVRDSEIHDNLAQNGGALYLRNSSTVLERAHLHDNDASHPISQRYGGAIYATEGGSLTVIDSIIENNVGANEGGAIFADGLGSLDISGSTIQLSSASGQGGALLVQGGLALTINGSDFLSNNAPNWGGAMALLSYDTAEIGSNRFQLNGANLGGAFYAAGGDLDLHHNLFQSNTGNITAASVYLNGVATGRMMGNSFEGDITPGSGSSILLSNSPIPVRNNIIANVTGSACVCSGGHDLDYNLVHANSNGDYVSCTLGPGSLSGDPNFVDAPAGDLHLGVHSAALDSGDPADSDADGGPADMGWYGSHVFASDQPSYPQNPAAQVVGPDLIISWDANPEADIASYIVYGSASSGFTPGAGNVVATVLAPSTSANLGASGDQYFRVAAVDGDGYSSGFSAEVEAGAVATESPRYRTMLLGNAPNPFNPSTTIHFELRARAHTELRLYDVAGRAIRVLWSGPMNAGPHAVRWDGRDAQGRELSSGVYFYRLSVDGVTLGDKMLLIK